MSNGASDNDMIILQNIVGRGNHCTVVHTILYGDGLDGRFSQRERNGAVTIIYGRLIGGRSAVKSVVNGSPRSPTV